MDLVGVKERTDTQLLPERSRMVSIAAVQERIERRRLKLGE
jgi:hypothetical protein